MKGISLLILITCILSCKPNIDKKTSKIPQNIFKIKKISVESEDISESIVEYVNTDGKDFVNQWWIVNKNDTINGNYFKLLKDDSTKLGEISRLQFQLVRPVFSWKSNMYIVMPSDDSKLEDDFSNLSNIKLDTFFNLQDDKIPHPEISHLGLNLNHIVQFGIEFESPGKKLLRGLVVETQSIEKKKKIRHIYFKDSLYVFE